MLEDFLAERFPGQERAALRKFVVGACAAFRDHGLGDANLEQELCSGDDARYCQRMSEILFGKLLIDQGLTPTADEAGPDFLVENEEGRRAWIEVICPEPKGIPEEYLDRTPGKCVSVPHEQILLRWTGAIKEKREKLARYLEKGLVAPDDSYVIAINARMLSDFPTTGFLGISQFPYAVEAVFAVGPLAIQIDRETLKAVKTEHQHRPIVPKANGAGVPASVFLNDDYAGVSAIWAGCLAEWYDRKQLAVIHNPKAAAPLDVQLPAYEEFRAVERDADTMSLDRLPGVLEAEQ